MTKLESDQTDAEEMAKLAGVNPKTFRQNLRSASLHWHRHDERWIVQKGSTEHEDMKRVLDAMLRGDAKN